MKRGAVEQIAAVALLAEGVDRNEKRWTPRAAFPESPSSRRAWIEIMRKCPAILHRYVALLAEGVDRNHPMRGATA